jgi:hypothetical protein
MIEYPKTTLEKVAVHSVGNKTNNESLYLSKSPLNLSDPKVKELLLKYFLQQFGDQEMYSFSFSNGDFTMNPVFKYVAESFDTSSSFHKNSINLAKHLFELSTHPKIKSGDLFVAHFDDIILEDEVTEAIGLFKSETRQEFLKVDSSQDDFVIRYDDGINIDSLDKACLIFNTFKDQGFRVCIIDKFNRGLEAQYWRDNFLQVKRCSDEYHHTKEMMTITKNFVVKQMPKEQDVSKPEQIELLNRSLDYFKNNDSFKKKDFEKKILKDTEIIKAFRDYDKSYREAHNVEPADQFDISPQAVKKQTKAFKSVIKLDKNFLIYVQGDSELIKQGVEKDGRKFYKIYFDKET